jgi:hypothetical protein
MKRLMSISIVCAVLSASSFGVLLLEDRRLGVPLPYSLPLAALGLIVLAPLAWALVEWTRARRPIVVQAAPLPAAAAAEPAASPFRGRRRVAEGVVLLDSSSFPPGVRAA